MARRRVTVGVLGVSVATIVAGLFAAPFAAAASPPLLYLSESFTGSQVQIPADWVRPALPSGTTGGNVACLTASGTTSQAPIPGCSTTPLDTPGSGTLRLTSAAGNLDGGTSYATAVPSSQGLDISFDTYQYGGNGADGILLYLAGTNPLQPSSPATLGPPGGHLGYSGGTAAPTGPGIVGGYLGIGLDVYGNYSNNGFDGSGCTDPTWAGKGTTVPNQVTVRGPGSGTTGYCLLSSSAGSGGLKGKLDGGATGTRATSMVPVEVAINPTAATISTQGIASVPAYSYVIAVSPLGGPTQYASGSLPNASAYEPASWLEPSTGIPYQLAFGFAASTGGSNDIHEVRNVQVQPLFTNPARASLQLTDSAAGHLVAGTAVTYTATPSLSTQGGTVNQPLSFTDTFPTGVTPGAATGTDWSCTTNGQTVTCAYTGTYPIAAGSTLPSVTVPTTVAATATGTVDDTGQLVSDDAQVATETDPGTVGPLSVPPVLGVSLSDGSGGAYAQGGGITYRAIGTVSSGGGAETVAPQMVDVFPAGVTPGTASGTGWSCATVGQTVTCNYTAGVPIAGGTTLPTVSLPATVGLSSSGGITDTVTLSASDASPSSVTASDSGSILSIPRYGLTLTDNRSGNFTAGGTVTYTATPSLSAAGGSESAAPTYTQTLSTSMTPTAASGTNWSCTISGHTATCAYTGSLPITAGTTLPSITISASVSGSATGNLSSTGTVQSSDGSSATALDSAAAGHAPPPILTVAASSPSQSYPGTTYTMTITPAVGTGGGPASSHPTLSAVLPAGETFAAAPAPAGWTCSLGTTTVTHDTLTCTSTATTPVVAGTALGTVPATVTVAPGTPAGSLSATTTLSDTTDGAVTVSTGTTITIVATPVLSVTTTSPAGAVVGSTASVAVSPSLSSSGGPAFSDPQVVVDAPSGATFTTAPTPAGWTCVLGTGNTVLTCTSTATTPIAAGSALGVIDATVTFSSTPGAQTTTATLSDTNDGATAAVASATTTTTATPVLAVTATSPGHAAVGTTGTVAVTPSVSASGGPAYSTPEVTLTAPSGATFTTAPTPAGWTCVLGTGDTVLTCTSTATTPIAAGSALGVIDATVTFSSTPGAQTTTATLSDTTDGATAAVESATTTTTATPVLAVTVGAPATAVAGSTGSVAVTPSVSASGGPVYAEPRVVVDAPSGATFTTAPTPAGWTCVLGTGDTVLTCTSTATTPIAAGSALGVIDATVTFSPTPGAQTTTATLSDTNDGATAAVESATTTTTATPVLAVTATSPGHAAVGTTGTVAVSPSVSASGGPAYAEPKVVVDAPSGATFTTAPTPAGWTCVLGTGNTVLTCTSTATTPIAAGSALGVIDATVTFSPTPGTQTTTATLSDTNDGATAAVESATTTTTATPVLAVTATSPGHAAVGTTGTVAVTPSVSASGGPAYSTPEVTLTAPSGATFTTAPTPAGWTCVLGTGDTVLTCTSTATTPIAAGSALGVIDATVTFSSTPGAQTTTATLSDTTDGATAAVESATTTTTATPVLAVTVGAPATAVAGSTGSVAVTPSVSASGGPVYAEPRVVVDAPSGATFTTAPTPAGWTCVLGTGNTVLTCTSTATTPIAAGSALGVIDATVTFSSTPGAQTTTATLSDTTDGATAAVDSAITTTTGTPTTPVLSLSVSAPAQAVAGSHALATITPALSAAGGPAHSDPVLTVAAPSGATFTTAPTPTGWTCVLGTGGTSLTCTSTKATPIPAGSALGVIDATVSFSSTPGTQTTSATLSDTADGATPVTQTATTSTTATPVLTVTATSSTHAYVGTTATVTVTPSLSASGGPAYAEPKVVVDAPSGATFTAAPTPAGWTCVLGTGDTVLTCTSTATTPIAAGSALGVIDATVTFSPTPGAQTTTATLSDTTDGATPVTRTAVTTTTVLPVLTVTATSPTHAYVGTTGTVTVTPSLSASGGPAYSTPAVTITAPSGATFTTAPTPAGWTCVLGTGDTVLTCTSTATKPIAAGTPLGVIDATVTFSSTPGTQTTSVTLSDPDDGATPVTRTAATTSTTVPVPALTVVSPTTATAGSHGTVAVTPSLSASGGPAYSGPKVVVTAPAGASFTSAPTSTGWTCVLGTGDTVLTCTSTRTTPIAAGTSLGTIDATVAFSSTPGAQTTSATLSDTTDGATPVTRTATTTTTPAPTTPTLSVTVSAPTTAMSGAHATITVTSSTTTTGGPAHSDPQVTISAPTGATFAATPAPTGWTCVPGTGRTVLTCTSTAPTPIAAGTSLGTIDATVAFSPNPGPQTTSATLSDVADGATPVTRSATTTTTDPAPTPYGYRLAGSDGGVFAFGQDSFLGSLVSRGVTPTAPISGMAATHDGGGYWLVGQDGNVYTFGNAQNYGSLYAAHVRLNAPIVGIVATPDDKGYWMVASDGGVFNAGDAGFYGNTYTLGIEHQLDKPIVGMTADSSGHGYWLVASDGGVFAFGDAAFHGNTYTLGIENQLDKPVVGMAPTPDGGGYWLVAADGGVFAFGDAAFHGNTYTIGIENQLDKPMVGMGAMPDGGGYWLVAADGGVFAFGDAPFLGNTYTIGIENELTGPIVALTEAP